MIQIFFIVWFYVLPILAITLSVLIPVFWFFIVPKVARMLTWNRFRNVSIHAVGDHAGFVELVATKEHLPEGIVRTKRGWRFLPKPIWDQGNPGLDEDEQMIEQIALRKYVLKDYGKPFWFGHAGKVASVNPGTLAALQQDEKPLNIDNYFSGLEEFTGDMPKHFSKPLTKKLKTLKEAVKAKPYTIIDIDKIKQVVTKMYPPSMIDALAENRLLKGKRQAGKQYGGLILGGVLIIGMVIALIVVASFLLG